MNTTPLTIESSLNVPIGKVWAAITNRDQMKQWYFDLAEFIPLVGFEFRFTGGKDGREYLHICMITELIEGKKLTYSWRYDGYDGVSYVTFELTAEGEQTRLTLTHSGLETFPANNPDFARENFDIGWTYLINTSLQKFIEF